MQKLKPPYIRQTEVLALVMYSAPHIWRLEKEGKFPKRVKIGPNRVAWLREEIDAWLQAKLEARDPVKGVAAVYQRGEADKTEIETCGKPQVDTPEAA